MKAISLCMLVFSVLCTIVLFTVSNWTSNSIVHTDDEVGLSELKRYATAHSLRPDDFEQPTIWAQLTSDAKKDPRGPCVTVCYKTRSNINPRHILLLYLTPRGGIIDEESLVEGLPDGNSPKGDKQKEGQSTR